MEHRKKLFESWYSQYGTSAKKGRYFQALRDPHYVLTDRSTNPVPGYHQHIDITKYPPHSVYEWDDLLRIRALFDETPKARVADDGSMHTAVGNYALWLRLYTEDREWVFEPLWDGDDVPPGSGAKSRVKTLNENGFDYLKALDLHKRTYMMKKYLAAIRTKPFILLAGISGTGKSRLVRQLARGCCPEWADAAKTVKHPFVDEQKPGNFEIIPVRPNWHDSTELMGYESRINGTEFIIKPFVEFLIKAWLNPDIPFFLCLDEMNLAPVEQYFAEYLSAIESRKAVTGGGRTFYKTDVLVKMGAPENQWVDNGPTVLDKALSKLFDPYKDTTGNLDAWATYVRELFVKDGGVSVPQNMVVMGTVNMDETTCTFSRKVLDRAMSFELNDVSDMYDKNNLAAEKDLDFGCLGQDATKCTMLTGAEAYAADNGDGDKVLAYLEKVNGALEGTPFKIAYRSRNEIMIYCVERKKGGVPLAKALDEATSMKILSRIEGDDQRFARFKLKDFRRKVVQALLQVDTPAATPADADAFVGDPDKVVGSPCAAKLTHMIDELEHGAGFVSYWE